MSAVACGTCKGTCPFGESPPPPVPLYPSARRRPTLSVPGSDGRSNLLQRLFEKNVTEDGPPPHLMGGMGVGRPTRRAGRGRRLSERWPAGSQTGPRLPARRDPEWPCGPRHHPAAMATARGRMGVVPASRAPTIPGPLGATVRPMARPRATETAPAPPRPVPAPHQTAA